MKKLAIYAAAMLLWLPTLVWYAATKRVLPLYRWLYERWKEAGNGC